MYSHILPIVQILLSALLAMLTLRLYTLSKKQGVYESKKIAVNLIAAIFAVICAFSVFFAEIRSQREKDEDKKLQLELVDSLFKANLKVDSLVKIIQSNSTTINSTVNTSGGSVSGGIFQGNHEVHISQEPKPKTSEVVTVAKEVSKSKYFISKGNRVVIVSNGSISFGPNIGTSDPDGTRTTFLNSMYCKNTKLPFGSLLYKFEGENEWKFAGRELEFMSKKSGQILFVVNDKITTDNENHFDVTVKVFEE